MTNASDLTRSREVTHGDYKTTSQIAQQLKSVVRNGLIMRKSEGRSDLTTEQRESLDLICTKIARAISGDPNEPDHWHDISGYAHLAYKKAGE